MFTFDTLKIAGPRLITPQIHGDMRGYFMETYRESEFAQNGIDVAFVQDNQSSSHRGVLRGLHFQVKHPQGKLVRVISGKVFDVAVDIREGSPTFGQWCGVILDATGKQIFYIPEGFAHGFLVLSDMAEFVYSCTNYYDPSDESGIKWNDPQIAIEWPIEKDTEVILSDKDRNQQSFKEYCERRRA